MLLGHGEGPALHLSPGEEWAEGRAHRVCAPPSGPHCRFAGPWSLLTRCPLLQAAQVSAQGPGRLRSVAAHAGPRGGGVARVPGLGGTGVSSGVCTRPLAGWHAAGQWRSVEMLGGAGTLPHRLHSGPRPPVLHGVSPQTKRMERILFNSLLA